MDTPSITETVAPANVITIWNGGMTDPAAAVVNEYTVLSIPAFWSGVRFLSETLASLPKGVYQTDGASRQPVNHPQNRLLTRKANAFTTPFVVFETWHSHAIIHGNGYLFIERDQKTAAPIGYYPLNPQSTTPFRFKGAQWYMVRGGAVKPNGQPDNLILPAADVLHLPGLGFDGMVGFPLVWLMYEALELARNGQRFASRYFRKGTQIQGTVEIPGTATKEQVDSILDRLRRSHSGMDSDYSLNILTGGAKMSNSTIPPEQSQLLESRQFEVLDMCRILRVPPHVVYDMGKATWANVESMGIEVVKYSLSAWVEKASQELSCKLLTEAEQDKGLYIRYGVDALLRGDTATQTSTTLALVNGGLLTANEGRAKLDLPPLPDPTANQLRIPVNFPVSKPTEEPKPTNKGAGADYAKHLAPIIADAVNRVEAKTVKAFANREGKELVVWGNVFADSQAEYARQALEPIAEVLEATTGRVLDLSKIAERYAAIIRAKAAGQPTKPLAAIVQEFMNQ